MVDLILIQPPVVPPSEPPLGISLIAHALSQAGYKVVVIDANLEGILHLFHQIEEGNDHKKLFNTTDRRAFQQRARAIRELRGTEGYACRDRYQSAVQTLNRNLQIACYQLELGISNRVPSSSYQGEPRWHVTLSNFEDAKHCPLSSRELHEAAACSGSNPFVLYYRSLAQRIRQIGPRLIGISVNYLHQALPAMSLAGVLRERLPETPILMGGALPTLWQKKLGKDAFRPWIDTLVSDNGMEVLCNRLAQPVRGLDFSSEKCGSETSHLFFPDYHQAPWEKYLVPYPIIPIHTSYGCYWGRCQYCPEALQDNVHEVISENKLSQIIEAIARPHSSGMIHFTDNALPPTILDFLCKHAALLPWFGFARISPELGKKAYVEQ